MPIAANGATESRFRSLELVHYQLRLPTFEGPLDVLLRLVEREHLPIADVALVAVTDQFIAYLDRLDGSQPSLVAAFSAVAARLTLLKSRSLLPRMPDPADEADPDDLVRQLIEYRRLKVAALTLADRDQRGVGAFPPRQPPAPPAREPAPPMPQSPLLLCRALRRRLARLSPVRTDLPLRPIVSLPDVVAWLGVLLRRERAVSFRSFVEGLSREHAMVAFMAVLVLLRRRLATAEQPSPFGDILVYLADPPMSVGARD